MKSLNGSSGSRRTEGQTLLPCSTLKVSGRSSPRSAANAASAARVRRPLAEWPIDPTVRRPYGQAMTFRTSQTPCRRRDIQPEWARRGERAIPKLDVPRMKQIDPNVMDDLRPIVQTLIARPLIAGPGGVRGDDGAGMVVGHADRRVDAVRLDAVRGAPPTSRRFGLSPRWRHFWLGALGCLVVESGHTLLATHTVHHRDGSDAPDPEGYIEYLSWREMPVGAARYRYRLMWWGWRYGAHRRRIRAELAVHAALHLVSLTLLPVNPILWIYLTLIHIASFAFAVLQSKGPRLIGAARCRLR